MAEKSFFSDIDYENDVIACVGDNLGWIPQGDIDWIIADGFSSSVKYLYESACLDFNIDALVYPIFYNARQSIENLLKYIIREIARLEAIRTKTIFDETAEVKKNLSHNIENLYTTLCTKSKSSDKRIKDYIKSHNNALSLVEYFYFDSKSDSFRYAYDSKGNLNLHKKLHVSVTRIVDVHEKIISCLNRLVALTGLLQNEYSLGIYTSKLSRDDLDKISSELHNVYTEGKEQKDFVINKIMSEYSLNKTELDEAVEIIKKDRTLSWRIGEEQQIPFSESFIKLVLEIKPIMKAKYDSTPGFIEFHFGDSASLQLLEKEKAFHDSIELKCSNLTKEDQDLFLAVCNIGNGTGCYGEYFDSILDQYKNTTWTNNRDFCSKLIWISSGRFEKGLRICGQPTLLQKFGYDKI